MEWSTKPITCRDEVDLSEYRLIYLSTFIILIIMATPLLQQFPSLATHPPSFLKDLLSSPPLTEAFLFTLPEVHELAAEVEKLGRENEDLASGSSLWLLSLQGVESDRRVLRSRKEHGAPR